MILCRSRGSSSRGTTSGGWHYLVLPPFPTTTITITTIGGRSYWWWWCLLQGWWWHRKVALVQGVGHDPSTTLYCTSHQQRYLEAPSSSSLRISSPQKREPSFLFIELYFVLVVEAFKLVVCACPRERSTVLPKGWFLQK